METQLNFARALSGLDLGPLSMQIEAIEHFGPVDAHLTLCFEGDCIPFIAKFKDARDLRTLQGAVLQARRFADETTRQPLVVVPYLNDKWLAFLREKGVSGIDLSGNGWVQVPGRWGWFQRGFSNRFPVAARARIPYRGKSAMVGRVLLSRPRFNTIGEVHEEIRRRDGLLSLGQISKVLSALEDDLVVRKGDEGVRLIQPAKLLDSLAEWYRPPHAIQEANFRADLGPDLLAGLVSRARAANARIVGYEPARYVIAPQAGERLLLNVEPHGFSSVANLPETELSRRFANLTIRAIKEPLVFFDAEEEGGFKWCSRLETYFQLMQGGKRERESAIQLRADLLNRATVPS